MGSIPRSGRSPGEGNGNPLQCSCLEKSTDKGAWWAIVHGVEELDMTELVSLLQHTQLQVFLSEKQNRIVSKAICTSSLSSDSDRTHYV